MNNDSVKYFTDIYNVESILDTYGVAIIPSILDNNECDQMVNDMWDYLEHITQEWGKESNGKSTLMLSDQNIRKLGECMEQSELEFLNQMSIYESRLPIDRNDKYTWNQIYKLNHEYLIFQFWNIGQSQLCWNVRQNPKIVDIYAKIYNVEPTELAASFDGASIQFPPEITNFGWRENSKEWFHVDHSYLDSTFKNVQSWVTAYDVNDNDATLVILESSHIYHKECGKMLSVKSPKDFTMLNDEQLSFYLSKCKPVHICCPKGSLVLWDSRTVHYGCEPTKKRLKPNTRCISYLCYTPKNLIDKCNYDRRMYAFQNLDSTNHDPTKVTLKYRTPYYNKNNVDRYITKINRPVLTDLGKSLIY